MSCHIHFHVRCMMYFGSFTFWALPAFFQILFPQQHGPLHHSPKLNGSETMAQSATFMKCCNRSAASKKALDTVFMCTYTNNQFIIPTETLPLWEYRHRNFIFNTAVCQIAVGIKGFRKQTIFAQNPGFEYEKRERVKILVDDWAVEIFHYLPPRLGSLSTWIKCSSTVFTRKFPHHINISLRLLKFHNRKSVNIINVCCFQNGLRLSFIKCIVFKDLCFQVISYKISGIFLGNVLFSTIQNIIKNTYTNLLTYILDTLYLNERWWWWWWRWKCIVQNVNRAQQRNHSQCSTRIEIQIDRRN